MQDVPPPRWSRLAAPTALSAVRLPLAAVFPMVDGAGRIVVVALATASDGLDGLAARRLGCTTWWGGTLDAVADKVFAVSVVVCLVVDGTLALWHLPLVLARDLTVALAGIVLAIRRNWSMLKEMSPRPLGKAATFGQFLLFIVLLCTAADAGLLRGAVLVLTVTLSILAAADYLLSLGPRLADISRNRPA